MWSDDDDSLIKIATQLEISVGENEAKRSNTEEISANGDSENQSIAGKTEAEDKKDCQTVARDNDRIACKNRQESEINIRDSETIECDSIQKSDSENIKCDSRQEDEINAGDSENIECKNGRESELNIRYSKKIECDRQESEINSTGSEQIECDRQEKRLNARDSEKINCHKQGNEINVKDSEKIEYESRLDPDITVTNNEKSVFTENSKAAEESDKKKRKKMKRKPARKKLNYISSSDEDVPLIMYAKKYIQQTDSEADETFVPNPKELNTTDSEYSSNLSDTNNRCNKRKRQINKRWDTTVRKLIKQKKPETARKQLHNKCMTSSDISDDGSSLNAIIQTSFHEEMKRSNLITANEGRLDQLLNDNNLQRKKVPPHGNCFFHAACNSELVSETHVQLRQSLCSHLEENALDYMGFLLNKFSPDKEEDFVTEYLLEIENLKKDGYWSSKVADFLPLALANHVNCSVTIYTSKPDQPKITVEPTARSNEGNNDIKLAYISVPHLLEHYDACVAIQDNNSEIFIATPIQTGDNEESPSVSVNKSPKKAASFVSPVKKRLFRKRKATPQNWKKNVRKRLRLSGEEYVGSTGKIVQKKQVQSCDCSKCKYKCNSQISFEQRCEIKDLYYALESFQRQKDYICAHVEERNTKTYLDDDGKKVDKKKQVMRVYSLEVDGKHVRVCKKFFLKTFSISEATVNHALSKKVSGHFHGKDERGRHRAPNKTSEEKLEEIRKHIESFPTVESHYVRKSTNKQYLATDLNIKKMYEAYESKCKESGTEAVNEPIYRRIFNEEYNMSFHVPKKDQCIMCNKYHSAKSDGTLDEKTKQEYTSHQTRKTLAREQKHNDSNLARQNNNIHTCTFDLQSVLYTPCSLVSVMYYMRKLCCYNLSVYSAGDKKATCFLWSETDGKRGSNEISTCLSLYLSSLEPKYEHVILYSDACTGQNRNQIVATALLHTVNTLPNIKIIDHKFLESGHTHMECDSMHAAIEFAKSKTKIFVPGQWNTVISMARRRNPYHVVSLKYYDFKDFKGMRGKATKPSRTEIGQKPKWTNMKWMRFMKSDPEMCHFKYNFQAEEFHRVKLSGIKQANEQQLPPLPLPLYKSKLPISSAKKKDLVSLCKKGAIPREFHEYYKGLPASQSVKGRLPEPDIEESEDDTDFE